MHLKASRWLPLIILLGMLITRLETTVTPLPNENEATVLRNTTGATTLTNLTTVTTSLDENKITSRESETDLFTTLINATESKNLVNDTTSISLEHETKNKHWTTTLKPELLTESTAFATEDGAHNMSALCLRSPCKNGATCIPSETYFTCNCSAGFNGSICEININDCLPNPCLRGICIDKIDAYQCVCPAGWNGTKCDKDVDECSINVTCDANAVCHNTPGSFKCECNSGFYGDGFSCFELMMLSTENATKLTKSDFNRYSISYKSVETSIPFVIGTQESSICKISMDGYLSFTDPPFQLDYPTSYKYLVKPMVFPYWSYKLSFANNDSAVFYELLDNSGNNVTENWVKISEILTNSSGANDTNKYVALSALIVTWNKLQPYSYYNELCYYCKTYSYNWAKSYCKYCDLQEEHISFQAIVTRNETHSFVIFNYGQFQLNEWRWYWYYVAAGFTDGYRNFSVLPFSYKEERNDHTTDNLVMGNVGKRGRHVVLMANSIPPSNKLKCVNWMAKEETRLLNTTPLTCTNCPRDMRQAVLDWRYWPYQYKCDKTNRNNNTSYDLYMCFEGRYQCIQYFPRNYSCQRSRWSWYCDDFQQCQFYSAPRCCYQMKVNWLSDELVQDYCEAGYSLWTMRWLLRNIMFDRNESQCMLQSINMHCFRKLFTSS